MIKLVKFGKRNLLLSLVMFILIISISITTFAAFSATATVTGTITFIDPDLMVETRGVGGISVPETGVTKTFTYNSGFETGITNGSDMFEYVTANGSQGGDSGFSNALCGEYIEYGFKKAENGVPDSGTDVNFTFGTNKILSNDEKIKAFVGFEFSISFPKTINYNYVYPAINETNFTKQAGEAGSYSPQTVTDVTTYDDIKITTYKYTANFHTDLYIILMCVNIGNVGNSTVKTYRAFFGSNPDTIISTIPFSSEEKYQLALSDFFTGIRCVIGVGSSGEYFPMLGAGNGVNATRTVTSNDNINISAKCLISVGNVFSGMPEAVIQQTP